MKTPIKIIGKKKQSLHNKVQIHQKQKWSGRTQMIYKCSLDYAATNCRSEGTKISAQRK